MAPVAPGFPGFTDSDRYYIAFAIRIASIAVAGYDFLETFPAACKFYASQWRERRTSFGASLILFALIQMSSILILVISSYGFFAKFNQQQCNRFFLLAPAFKVLQGMVSHCILGLRAYTVSSKNKRVGWFMLAFFVVVVVFEWITTIGKRVASVDVHSLSCRPLSVQTTTLFSAWIYYLLATLFDVAATGITGYYLITQLRTTSTGLLSQVVKDMLTDGIGYILALACINSVNIWFYSRDELKDLQNAFASVGYAVTWILSQRLILHLHRASLRKRDDQIMTGTSNGLITVTQNLSTSRSVNYALRTQFSQKQPSAFTDLTVPEFSMDLDRPSTSTPLPKTSSDVESQLRFNQPAVSDEEMEDSVEVRVEKTVKVSNTSKKVRYELEDYSRGSRGAVGVQEGLRRI